MGMPLPVVFRSDIHFDTVASVGSRSVQEDYALFTTNRSGTELLAVLADGIGGHSSGHVASKLAVDAFHSTFNAYPEGSILAKLGAALNQANTDLATNVKDSPRLRGMGCTLVGVHIGDQGLQWISVGDSLLVLYRGGKLRRLNADHSMAPVIAESQRLGKITKEEARSHPDRHALRSAVSGEDLAMIDTSSAPIALEKGDIVILASDGLLTLSDFEITQVIREQLAGPTAQALASALLKAVAAKQKPKQDNTTIQIVITPMPLGSQRKKTVLSWLQLVSVLAVVAIFLVAYFLRELPFKWPRLLDVTLKQQPSILPMPTPIPVPNDVLPVSIPAKAASLASTPATSLAPPALKDIKPTPVSNGSVAKTIEKMPPIASPKTQFVQGKSEHERDGVAPSALHKANSSQVSIPNPASGASATAVGPSEIAISPAK
jgi:serine/threonine protein phosphatase PrpC